MAKLSNRFPLRVKIAALIGVALTLSLAIFLWMSFSLFASDKESYILDYNLTRVQSAAATIDHQIETAFLRHRLAEALHLTGGALALRAFAEESFDDEHLKAILVIESDEIGRFQVRHSFPFESPEINRLIEELGWTPFSFERTSSMIGVRSTGELVIASKGRRRVYVSLVRPAFGNIEAARGYQLALVSRLGEVINAGSSSTEELSLEHKNWIAPEALTELTQSMFDGAFESGAQTWKYQSQDYMTGYIRLRGGELGVVGIIPKKAAFAATRSLISRGLLLGASLMAIAVALVLLFGGRITSGLRQMVHATRRVTEGVFSFRVDIRGMGNDEIGSLASSFNQMAQRIDDLMDQTAEKAAAKAALEKELETVRAVQENFLPDEHYSNLRFSLAGSTSAGSHFPGEWWHYGSHLDHVVVVSANTSTGGAMGAMLTAAAHSAFMNFMATTRMISDRPPDLRLLMQYINTALHGAARGRETMTCFAAIIDTFRGVAEVANAGHPPAWLYRLDSKEARQDKSARFRQIECPVTSPLGASPELELQLTKVPLRAGDALVLRTRSMTELLNIQGEIVAQSRIHEELASLFESHLPKPEKICERFFEKAVPSLTGRRGRIEPGSRQELTLVVGTVPKDADLHPDYVRAA